MKLSVVTVCLNSRATIAEAVRSVHAQTLGDVEHIVVDGGSTDGTLEILQAHRAGISTLISESDSGLYFAMNKGIEAATGEYLGFLNSDDVYHHDHVLERVAKMHGSVGQATRSGKLDVISAQDFQHLRAHQPHNEGHLKKRQRY